MDKVVDINKVQEAAIRVQSAAKNVAEAAKDNKKTIAIIAACTVGVAVIGLTAYVTVKAVKPTFVFVKSNKDTEEEES